MAEDELIREIAALEAELASLQTDEATERSTFTALEDQLAEVSARIALARRTAAEREARLEQARLELAEAQREDTYREAQRKADAAAEQLAEAIGLVLSALAAYDDARQAVMAARSELAPSVLARLAPYLPDPAKHEVLAEPWKRLVSVVGARADEELEDELVEAAARSAMGHAIPSLPAHLRELARRRRDDHLQNLKRSLRPGADSAEQPVEAEAESPSAEAEP